MADRRTLSLGGGGGSSAAGWSLDSQGLRQTWTHWDEGEAFSLLFLDRQFCFHSVIFCPNFPIYGKASSVPALLPGDPPVFKNKWCGLSGDPSVALVPGIRCRPTSWMWGREPAQRWGSQDLPSAHHPSRISPGQRREDLRTSMLRAAVLSRGHPNVGALQPCRGLLVAGLPVSGWDLAPCHPSFFMCLFFYY